MKHIIYSTIILIIGCLGCFQNDHTVKPPITQVQPDQVTWNVEPFLSSEMDSILRLYIENYIDSSFFCAVYLVDIQQASPVFQLYGWKAIKSFLMIRYLEDNIRPSAFTVIGGRLVFFYSYLNNMMARDDTFFNKYNDFFIQNGIIDDWDEDQQTLNSPEKYSTGDIVPITWTIHFQKDTTIINKTPTFTPFYPVPELYSNPSDTTLSTVRFIPPKKRKRG